MAAGCAPVSPTPNMCRPTRSSMRDFRTSSRSPTGSRKVPAYTQFNAGLSHEFKVPDWKPVTARFDVVNVLDQVYEIRDGSGIGVFAPQFGPRRAYMFGLSQKL